jgi:hypothetical protein
MTLLETIVLTTDTLAELAEKVHIEGPITLKPKLGKVTKNIPEAGMAVAVLAVIKTMPNSVAMLVDKVTAAFVKIPSMATSVPELVVSMSIPLDV